MSSNNLKGAYTNATTSLGDDLLTNGITNSHIYTNTVHTGNNTIGPQHEWITDTPRDYAAEAMVDTADILAMEAAIKNIINNDRLLYDYMEDGTSHRLTEILGALQVAKFRIEGAVANQEKEEK